MTKRRRGGGDDRGQGFYGVYGVDGVDVTYGGGQLGEGGRPGSDIVQGGETGGEGHVSGGGPDYQGKKGLPQNWPCGGDVEGSDGDFKLRLMASTTFHDFLHGFRAGCGTGTITLEAKLLQQLATLRKEVLYMIFLDLHKTYDALDRSRCLEILEGYSIGP